MHRLSQFVCLSALSALAAPEAAAQWTTASLSQARSGVAVTTVGDLVLFAGGNVLTTYYADVDIYDAATDTWSTAALSVPRTGCAATSVGSLAFFAGGSRALGPYTDVVDVFDAQTMTWSVVTLSQPRFGIAATTVGTKALFAGGRAASGTTTRVDIYDSAIGLPSNPLAWSTANLSQTRSDPTAVSVGDLAIFAGGWTVPGGVPVDAVDIYDGLSGTWSTATLAAPRILGPGAACAVGTRAYFGGGHASAMGGPNMSDLVDVYDAQLGVWSTLTMPAGPRGYMGVTALGNTLHFAAGVEPGFATSGLVETFNVGTEQWGAQHALSEPRRGPASATVGGKVVVAGGLSSQAPSAVVDLYEPVAVSYCVANANSTGRRGEISALGSKVVASNDLTLRATSLPLNAFGFFLTSQSAGYTPNPGGSAGDLCLAGPIGRYTGAGQIMNSGATGEMSLLLDLQGTPTPTGLVAVQVGETWHFQAWHRDAGSTSNLTDAIRVTFR